jgi:Na+-transporting methylmalonyl-CoA/oxaloacetate decarboxylase gamma subunit
MVALIAVLLLAALLFGIGFAFKFLWILAAIVLVIWLIGFVARSAESAWYRW